MKRCLLAFLSVSLWAQAPPTPSGSWVVVACPTNCSAGGGTATGKGLLHDRPACTKDTVGVWFSADQPEGLQISTCSAVSGAYRWVTPGSPGASGGLVVANGTTDIATDKIPRLNAGNLFGGQNAFAGLQLIPKKFADLPACHADTEGVHRWITDSSTNAWGEHVTAGGGALHVGVVCNGTAWTVYAK